MAKLTDKQKLFIEEYLISLDAQDAYMRAYKVGKGTAKTNGYRLLDKPEIRAEIDRRLQEIRSADPTIPTPEKILAEIASIAFDNSLRPNDRLKGLELLGKANSMFTDKIKQEGSMSITVDIEEDE